MFELNRKGFIPGPEEDEEPFLERVRSCRQSPELQDTLFTAAELAPPTILNEAFQTVSCQYDIAPDWVPVVFSNYQLKPWHGGSFWLFEQPDRPPLALLQLHPSLRDKKTLFAIYSRQELLAHELAHVGRMMFNEPIFEEFLAYRSSPIAFRRWLGPIVQSAFESFFFVAVLMATLMGYLTSIIFLGEPLNWLLGFPLGLFFFGLIRLCWRHYQMGKCYQKLCKEVPASNANAILYRLTDREIIEIGYLENGGLKNYISSHPSSPRWQIIKTYFRTRVQEN